MKDAKHPLRHPFIWSYFSSRFYENHKHTEPRFMLDPRRITALNCLRRGKNSGIARTMAPNGSRARRRGASWDAEGGQVEG